VNLIAFVYFKSRCKAQTNSEQSMKLTKTQADCFDWTSHSGHGKFCSSGSSQSETFIWSRSKLQPECPKISFSQPAVTLHSVMRGKKPSVQYNQWRH